MVGNLGAVIGSVVSVRIMLHFSKRVYGTEEFCDVDEDAEIIPENCHRIRQGSAGNRFIEAMLEGGRSGVQMGMEIIPGVLIICTMVLPARQSD